MAATCSYVVQRKAGRGYKSAYCSHKALPNETVCHMHTASAIAKRDAKSDEHWATVSAIWERHVAQQKAEIAEWVKWVPFSLR